MPERSEKLDRFTARLLNQASEESERTLRQLKEKHDAALASAEDEVLLEAYEYIHGEVSRIRTEQGRRVSRRLLERKQALCRRRRRSPPRSFLWCGRGWTPTPAPPPMSSS